MSVAGDRPFTIVQLSDLHCGQQFFLPNLLERAVSEVNDLAPDASMPAGAACGLSRSEGSRRSTIVTTP